MENWKDIDGYEGLYQISDTGNVKRTKSGRILKNGTHTCGYLQVNLYKDGKPTTISIHRLVAAAFISSDNLDEVQVNHINGIKTDNTLANLEWVTRSENINHATYSRLRDKSLCENSKQSKLTNEQVREIKNYDGKVSMAKLAKKYSVSVKLIWNIIQGRSYKHLTLFLDKKVPN